MQAHATNLPVPLLVLNGCGVLLMAAGALGMISPGVLPALSKPAVAWALIGVGFTLDAGAAIGIVQHVRKRARA